MTIHDIPSFNITSSLRLALEWANENCSAADLVLFVSDETFVNPFLLLDYLVYHLGMGKGGTAGAHPGTMRQQKKGRDEAAAAEQQDVFIDGLVRHTNLPVRKYNRDGFVSKMLYPDMIFPPYVEFANGALLSRKVCFEKL